MDYNTSGEACTDAAAALIRLWRDSRENWGGAHGGLADPGAEDSDNPYGHGDKDLECMNSLVATPCLPDSDEETTDEEDGKLTWKRLRSLGWTYVPGSRLGESLIDFFYLAPGTNVERAVKHENAFSSMEQVQAHLAGDTLHGDVALGKRRRDSPSSEDYADALGIHTPKHARRIKNLSGMCGIRSKRGMPCPQHAGACPYHNWSLDEAGNEADEAEGQEDYIMRDDDDGDHEVDDGLCGVVSQRGLRCPHRRDVCPYHTEAQRNFARSGSGRVAKDADASKKNRNAIKRDDSGRGKHGDASLELCGIVGARGLPCTMRRGTCPYHQGSGSSEKLPSTDTELCGVISQRGLPCTHRKHICPYHSENGSRRKESKKQGEGAMEAEHGDGEAYARPSPRARAREATAPQSPSEMETSSADDGKLSWKELKRKGWSYVPGSRLGESLIDFFYLPPGAAVESAIKYKNAFESMDQVQAYLAGEALQPPVHMEGKRRRDSPYYFSPDGVSGVATPERSPRAPMLRHPDSAKGLGEECDDNDLSGSSEKQPSADAEGLCGVISQRGLPCTHRKHICPYHSENGSRRAQSKKQSDSPPMPAKSEVMASIMG